MTDHQTISGIEVLEQELARPAGDRNEQARDTRSAHRGIHRSAPAREGPMTAVRYHVPGAVLTEREHEVPLDHARPDAQKITLFSRELAAPDGLDRPYLIFQQGGPGGEATRPSA